MSQQKTSKSDELEFWEVALEFYENRPFTYPLRDPDDNSLIPLTDEKGEPVPFFDGDIDFCPADENGRPLPRMEVNGKLVRVLTTEIPTGCNNANYWWPEIMERVKAGSVKMTVSKSLLGGDRMDIDPRMVPYLTVVEFKYQYTEWGTWNKPEPILQGPDGERLYAPRFVIVNNAPKPNINWSNIARRALRGKYPDGVLPAGATFTGVARDVLATAADMDSRLKEVMNNSELRNEAIEAMRKEITRQLTTRRMEKSRKKILPSSTERLQANSRQ